LLDRVEGSGFVRLVGETVEDRREMFKVARFLPFGLEVEIYEDPRLPGLTFMEVRPAVAPPQAEPSFRLVRPERAVGE
jgi:hypothetical protein